MFNKIQPQQIQLHAFSSPSGHMSFQQTDSTVLVNFNTGITGSFNIEGNLYINRGRVREIGPSNTILGTDTNISHGTSNFVSGTACLVGGVLNKASGVRNAILNGLSCQIDDTILDGTILAGYGGRINNDHDGSVLIADREIRTKSSVASNSFLIDFANGLFVQNDVYIADDLNIGGDVMITGNFNISGRMLYTGHEVVSAPAMTGYVSSVSGVLTGKMSAISGVLDSAIVATGLLLHNRILYDLDDLVRQTGNQTISGNKTFINSILMDVDAVIAGTGVAANSFIIEDDAGVELISGKSVTLSSRDGVILLLDHNGDGSTYQHNFDSIWDNSFIIASGNSDPDLAVVAFGVHPSGVAWIKDSIIIESPSQPSPADSNAAGLYPGQMFWKRISSTVSYLYLYNGTEWHRFAGANF